MLKRYFFKKSGNFENDFEEILEKRKKIQTFQT